MECNKDDAFKAKEIAEEKYAKNDIVGARKFALKAQTLFPGLDGISQMIATLDVHAAAELRINGLKDWYAILGVNPGVDEDAIKKQYRKLALTLHPDKNKSVGGEAAFKIISEAFSILSDKLKKMLYDRDRNHKFGQQTATSGPGSWGSFHHATKAASTNFTTQKSSAPASSDTPTAPIPPTSAKIHTFWTKCNNCNMQYEYNKVHLNNALVCAHCHLIFRATEVKKPTNEPKTFFHMSGQQSSNQFKNTSVTGMGLGGSQHGASFASDDILKSHFGVFGKNTAMRNTFSSTTVKQDLGSSNLATGNVRKAWEEKVEAATKEKHGKIETYFQKHAANTSVSGNHLADGGGGVTKQFIPSETETVTKKRKIMPEHIMNKNSEFPTWKNAESIHGNKRPSSNGVKKEGMNFFGGSVKAKVVHKQGSIPKKDISNLDLQDMLTQNARKLVTMKLEAWQRDAAAKLVAKQEKDTKKKQKQAIYDAMESENVSFKKVSEDDIKTEKPNGGNKHADSKDTVPKKDLTEVEDQDALSINVPDPDFHDFDKDRSESNFKPGQIWAIYDDEDGMPRFYCIVHEVLSQKPFKVRMSYLVSRTNSEFSSLNWVGMGFAKVCGDFRIGKHETCNIINIFSHVVRPERHPRGVIKILPKKGEIWALYKNWTPEWDGNTPDDVMYKYDIIEVLEDFKEAGISIAPLIKCAGFRTVFSRCMDQKNVMMIPKEEIFRFSHQVPCYILTGKEAQNAPSGCYELDPAATPLDLLQLYTEPKRCH